VAVVQLDRVAEPFVLMRLLAVGVETTHVCPVCVFVPLMSPFSLELKSSEKARLVTFAGAV
jgi:hypothetical protein